MIDAIKSMQQAQNPVIDTGSLREDFIVMLRNAVQAVSGPYMGFMLNMIGVIINHPEIYRVFYDQVVAPRFQQLAQMIQRAQTRGEIRRDIDVNEIIGLLAGPMWYHLLLGASNMASTPVVPERIVDVILQGLAYQERPEGGGAA
ncbi:MAG: TetR/AcrR family transcriptional regulator C-terminal ligand-binding domain-containing protein [Chloroflexi bacterium]|nr:TetR/AcrR family transcriptional regulator C-terminal ligand-binding domain-containing protein [Chloroflexota bacterium]